MSVFESCWTVTKEKDEIEIKFWWLLNYPLRINGFNTAHTEEKIKEHLGMTNEEFVMHLECIHYQEEEKEDIRFFFGDVYEGDRLIDHIPDDMIYEYVRDIRFKKKWGDI